MIEYEQKNRIDGCRHTFLHKNREWICKSPAVISIKEIRALSEQHL